MPPLPLALHRFIPFVAACCIVQAAEAEPSIVSHVTVLSDKTPDLSSIDAWKKAYIKEGMTDEQKAMAVWKTVVLFQHQEAPPVEYLQVENSVQDPIKMANVYGYSLCSVASAHVQALARAAGLQACGWTLNRHVVPEIMWNGKWHLLDASLIAYFPKSDGEPAGVEEIVGGIKQWYAEHPGFKGNGQKLSDFMRNGGWRKGPEILSRTGQYDENGWLPAATHGWSSTMQEYDGSTLVQYEAGYSTGYQVNVQLRPGERLIRNWGNKGLHINMDGGGDAPGCIKLKTGEENLRYTPKLGDLAPGRIGNGVAEYNVPLAGGAFRGGALAADNLASASEDGSAPAMHVKNASQPGLLELRMPSSYVYLSGALTCTARMNSGGSIGVQFSDNNGLDWKPVQTIVSSGPHTIDLKPLVFRRYDYRLRFTLKGAGTGFDALRLTHDIQHSQRPLPALAQGVNTITYRSGPQEGTITTEGSTDLANKSKQLVFTDFHPIMENAEADAIRPKGGAGSVTFPIHAPGEITRLRIHAFYRARDAKDGWDVQTSFDGGKTFQTAGKLEGPHVMMGKSFTAGNVPAGTRDALVKFVGTEVNTTVILNLRIDADYSEPRGGLLPVKVTYVWDEDGVETRDEHIATKAAEIYQINCKATPVMKTLIVEPVS